METGGNVDVRRVSSSFLVADGHTQTCHRLTCIIVNCSLKANNDTLNEPPELKVNICYYWLKKDHVAIIIVKRIEMFRINSTPFSQSKVTVSLDIVSGSNA